MTSSSRQRTCPRLLRKEHLESRLCLSSVFFALHALDVGLDGQPSVVFPTDIDGDGDTDVLTGRSDPPFHSPGVLGETEIAWYENTDGKGTLAEQKVIAADTGSLVSIYAADVDGDDDNDILAVLYSEEEPKVVWYENLKSPAGDADRNGEFNPLDLVLVLQSARYMTGESATWGEGDWNADGVFDQRDIIAALGTGNYLRQQPFPGFGPQQLISARGGFLSVTAADVDGDGDTDVLSAGWHWEDDVSEIAWYENTDGAGTFGEQRPIATRTQQSGFLQGNPIFAADIDNDSDIDILSGFQKDGKTVWYENTDGHGTFDERVIATFDAPRKWSNAEAVYAGDVDGDGDLDVLAAYGEDCLIACLSGRVTWYDNGDAKGEFGEQTIITEGNWARGVVGADIDGDGDMDVLAGLALTDFPIAWYENTDGKGAFSEQNAISPEGSCWNCPPVSAHDMNGDGRTDVVSSAGWHEQLPAAPGDANKDRQFDQQDIVQVLQTARYRTETPATFEEGDWNADGMFDQADMIEALLTGNYRQGPYDARSDRVFAGIGN